MEAKLNQSVQKMMTQVGATGVSVADKNGMQLISKGNMDPRIAASSTEMMSYARGMNPSTKSENPIIVLHSNNSKLTILNNHGETVTLHTK